MTPDKPMTVSDERPNVTDEMIEAGREELLRYEDRDDIREILPRVYRTMHAALSSPIVGEWQSIETAPYAMHFLAAKFDEDFGEWIYGILMRAEAIDRSFIHWQPLPKAPEQQP